MISTLRGTVTATGLTWLVIEVSGVGFRVDVPPSVTENYRNFIDDAGEIKLHTNLVVREDSMSLIGFLEEADNLTFQTLMTVAGIGPKLGLAAIESLGTQGLRSALAAEDLKALSAIPGVGKKTAQRMVLEIGDKLGPADSGAASTETFHSDVTESVEAALVQLGWTTAVAQQTIAGLATKEHTAESLLRAALEALGGQNGRSV